MDQSFLCHLSGLWGPTLVSQVPLGGGNETHTGLGGRREKFQGLGYQSMMQILDSRREDVAPGCCTAPAPWRHTD